MQKAGANGLHYTDQGCRYAVLGIMSIPDVLEGDQLFLVEQLGKAETQYIPLASACEDQFSA